MTDVKRTDFSNFYATNWLNNSGFLTPCSLYTPSVSVFDGYFSNVSYGQNWFNFNPLGFNTPVFSFNNFNFGFNFNFPRFNFIDWSLKAPAFDSSPKKQPSLGNADNLLKTPELKKPPILENDSFAHIATSKSGRTVKAIGKKGQWVDMSVHEATIEGTKVNTFSYTNLSGLRADLKHSVAELSKLAEQHGYMLVISDGYRSIAEQAAAKREKPKLVATPGYSPHNYGCAIDIALYKNGADKPADITKLSWFYSYAKNNLSLDWGHDWHSKDEPWHFERRDWQKKGSDAYREYCMVTGKKYDGA